VIPIIKPWLGEAEAEAARAAILSGWVAQGPRVRRFETAFAARVGAVEGVAVSSATAGLHLALVAADIGPGDEVIAPSLSFIATANAIRHAGADTVFADTERHSPNLSAAAVEAAITPRTAAVIAVHQLGEPCDLAAIGALCESRGLKLIEDAACAVGSTCHGRPVGGHSDLVVFSFHPRKLLTTGEGGMICCRDAEVAARLRRLRQHAMDVSDLDRHDSNQVRFERYPEPGWNYRMTDVQAAIGEVQLGRLERLLLRRRGQAARYRRRLGSCSDLVLAGDPRHGHSNFQTFWVRLRAGGLERRDAVLSHLLAGQVGARRAVMATHREACWQSASTGDLTETVAWADEALALPLYHQLTEAEQDHVIATLLQGLDS